MFDLEGRFRTITKHLTITFLIVIVPNNKLNQYCLLYGIRVIQTKQAQRIIYKKSCLTAVQLCKVGSISGFVDPNY